MCGIIGYVGARPATPVLLDSLQRLEYRGYDSAGIAVLDGANGGRHTVVKSDRKVVDLVARCERDGVPEGTIGIGHTRWATHGRPTVVNAHPLTSTGVAPRLYNSRNSSPRLAASGSSRTTASSAPSWSPAGTSSAARPTPRCWPT